MKNGTSSSPTLITARFHRDNFGLVGYVFTYDNGKEIYLTKTQVELLKEEIAEYDAERKRKRTVAGS